MTPFASAAAALVHSLLAIAQADPSAPAPAAGDEALSHAFSLDLQYARVNGFVQVRETTTEGTRLPLKDLGLDSAEAFSLLLDQRLTDDSRLSWRARWFQAAGSSSFDHEVVFNAVSYEANTTIRSRAELGDLTFHYECDLFHFAEGGSLALLAGCKFTYLNFVMRGTEAADTSGHDQKEDFWKQSLPLPSLGLRVDWPLTPTQRLYAEGFAWRAIGWNTLRSEGGTVWLTQDDFEASAGWTWRFQPKWELTVGARFDYLAIDEQSHEDGNVILMRSFGPFVAISLRF
jgi:hypothetical protein